MRFRAIIEAESPALAPWPEPAVPASDLWLPEQDMVRAAIVSPPTANALVDRFFIYGPSELLSERGDVM
jgi:hypothetical protein